jgi:hypothetical protein
MTISSRTPEGAFGRCPLCGAAVRVEPSCLTGDAPCPRCGRLLWFVLLAAGARFYDRAAIEPRRRLLVERALARACAGRRVVDSLDVVELVMELEEELGCTIPDHAVEKFRSPGDLIDYLVRQGPLRE